MATQEVETNEIYTELPIRAINGMVPVVLLMPNDPSPQDFELMARELHDLKATFWNEPHASMNWMDAHSSLEADRLVIHTLEQCSYFRLAEVAYEGIKSRRGTTFINEATSPHAYPN